MKLSKIDEVENEGSPYARSHSLHKKPTSHSLKARTVRAMLKAKGVLSKNVNVKGRDVSYGKLCVLSFKKASELLFGEWRSQFSRLSNNAKFHSCANQINDFLKKHNEDNKLKKECGELFVLLSKFSAKYSSYKSAVDLFFGYLLETILTNSEKKQIQIYKHDPTINAFRLQIKSDEFVESDDKHVIHCNYAQLLDLKENEERWLTQFENARSKTIEITDILEKVVNTITNTDPTTYNSSTIHKIYAQIVPPINRWIVDYPKHIKIWETRISTIREKYVDPLNTLIAQYEAKYGDILGLNIKSKSSGIPGTIDKGDRVGNPKSALSENKEESPVSIVPTTNLDLFNIPRPKTAASRKRSPASKGTKPSRRINIPKLLRSKSVPGLGTRSSRRSIEGA